MGSNLTNNVAAIANDIVFLMVAQGYDQNEENLIDKDRILIPNDLYNQILVNN